MTPAGDGDRLLRLADEVLARLGGEAAEVAVTASDSALTRFAGNLIHQNVADASLRLRLRLQGDSRVGVAELRGEAAGGVERMIAAAREAHRVGEPRPGLPPLPAPGGSTGEGAYAPATAACTPEQRAALVGAVIRAAERAGLAAFGALGTDTWETVVANTNGVRRHARASAARLVGVGRGLDGAGHAERCAVDVDAIDAAGLADELVDVAVRNQGAERVDPGVYEVVLSAAAAADLVTYLGWMSFNALAVAEGRSGVRLGERQTAELLTLRDDPTSAAVAGFPFDAEGVPARPVTLIEHGVSRAVVHDTATALLAGTESTGHSLPQPNTWGPLPTHLVVEPGDRSAAELIAGVRRGLYVTRFWYVRTVHELRTIITGMTREGTFLIEDGHISRPVRDLRFTESILGALATLRAVGRDARLHIGEGGGAALVPPLHLGEFRFTS